MDYPWRRWVAVNKKKTDPLICGGLCPEKIFWKVLKIAYMKKWGWYRWSTSWPTVISSLLSFGFYASTLLRFYAFLLGACLNADVSDVRMLLFLFLTFWQIWCVSAVTWKWTTGLVSWRNKLQYWPLGKQTSFSNNSLKCAQNQILGHSRLFSRISKYYFLNFLFHFMVLLNQNLLNNPSFLCILLQFEMYFVLFYNSTIYVICIICILFVCHVKLDIGLRNAQANICLLQLFKLQLEICKLVEMWKSVWQIWLRYIFKLRSFNSYGHLSCWCPLLYMVGDDVCFLLDTLQQI